MEPTNGNLITVRGHFDLDHESDVDRPDSRQQQDDGSRAYCHCDVPIPALDYPTPLVVSDEEEFIWNEDDLAINNYTALGSRLAASGDIYRQTTYANGLLLGSPEPNIEPVVINKGARLASIIDDRLRVRVVAKGKSKGTRIPSAALNTMLAAELFLRHFRPIDAVIRIPQYDADFELLRPGYNDGGRGNRVLYVGSSPLIAESTKAIDAFLNIMAFASEADRTNAVAAALTVLFRDRWPGAKPIIVATATKSHAGKDTVLNFAAGRTPLSSISYQRTDWALERAFVGTLKHTPDIGMVIIENARIDTGDKFIKSAFVERFLTDSNPFLFSTGTGGPTRIRNNVVLGLSTNFGTVSEDFMNRGLPIHLNPTGNVADRNPSIGNPRWEYLPANRERIEAELRGMVEKWKAEGKLLDRTVRHPFTEWSQTIGGILKTNEFRDFLGNYSLRRTADDPVRQGIGLLGSARPGEWLRSREWAHLVVKLGLLQTLIPEGDRHADESQERAIGIILSAHRDETFVVTSEDEKVTLRLEKGRRRFGRSEPSTRYQFNVLNREPLPVDEDRNEGNVPNSGV